MSAHRIPANARHVVQVLRWETVAGRGPLHILQVEALEAALRLNAEMLAALKACVAHFEGPPSDYSDAYSAALSAIRKAEAK